LSAPPGATKKYKMRPVPKEEAMPDPATSKPSILPRTAAHARHSVERYMHSRTTREGTRARAVEDVLKRTGTTGWGLLRHHPYLGAAAVGGGILAAASALGAAELGLGAASAYLAFQVLVGRERPDEALRNAFEKAEL
jgi:hypothetical protein